MKPGTFLWAMEQLIAGNKVARQAWDDKTFYYYNDDGVVMFNNKYDEPEPSNPPKGLANEDDWIIWHPPVSYIPGTFPWAWEQLKAGKKVKKKSSDVVYCDLAERTCKKSYDSRPWSSRYFTILDINSTDWEVVE